ncbi:MAG: hypothetical protein AB1486_01760 [Planctomycetota bacterium]
MQPMRADLLTCALLLLVPVPGRCQQSQGGIPRADLERRLEEQQVLNAELLKRIERLEDAAQDRASQRASQEGEEQCTEECLAPHDDTLDAIDDLRHRIDLLPVLAGYFDTEYFNDNRSESPGEFRQHRLSLHLSKELDEFRVFSEVEFEYGSKFEGDGGTALEEARGELKLEQAWGEYTRSDALVLRAGLILTPGYWNVNHYPNVVLPTRKPLMVGSVFPESFTGVMGYGSHYWDDLGTTYRVYAGNGESENSAKHDDSEGKALGSGVTIHLPGGDVIERLDVGISGYAEDPLHEEKTRTWGLDAQISAGGFELLSEFASRDSEEDRIGFYAQPSWRFDGQWAVFYRHDRLHVEAADRIAENTIGVNYRPISPVSLKGEVFRSERKGESTTEGIAVSFAIAF